MELLDMLRDDLKRSELRTIKLEDDVLNFDESKVKYYYTVDTSYENYESYDYNFDDDGIVRIVYHGNRTHVGEKFDDEILKTINNYIEYYDKDDDDDYYLDNLKTLLNENTIYLIDVYEHSSISYRLSNKLTLGVINTYLEEGHCISSIAYISKQFTDNIIHEKFVEYFDYSKNLYEGNVTFVKIEKVATYNGVKHVIDDEVLSDNIVSSSYLTNVEQILKYYIEDEHNNDELKKALEESDLY